MEPGVNLLHAISLFGRFSFALLLIIRPDHFGKRTCLYRGVGLFVLLGALLRLARDILPYLVVLSNLVCPRLSCLGKRASLGMSGALRLLRHVF